MSHFEIDPVASKVWISGRSSLHPINSQTDGLCGWIDVSLRDDGTIDTASPAAAHLEFPVERLKSGNPLEERELRRRIDAKRFPTIGGDLESISATADPFVYAVAGTITFRGVPQPHADQMSIEVNADGSLRVAGRSKFDVRDHGMQPPKILMLKVEPIVEIRVEIVAR